MMELEPKRKEMVAMSSSYASVNDSGEDNRMQFGVPEESSLGDVLGEGYGMLGQLEVVSENISGRSKLVAKVAKKLKEKNYGSSGATSGLTSNLAFTPVQEIHALRAQLEAEKYDVIKYCIGTLISISAVGLAAA
ncbi:hypothetical protein Dimus_030323, partial [Dionaea muscipula]